MQGHHPNTIRPLATSAAPAAAAAAAERATLGGATEPAKRVLVVDNKPEHVRTMGLRLRAAGYQVFAALDGVMATHVATTARPDVIVIDGGMPGDAGHDLARRWRSQVATRGIPIIYVTPRTAPTEFLRLVEQASQVGQPMVSTPPVE